VSFLLQSNFFLLLQFAVVTSSANSFSFFKRLVMFDFLQTPNQPVKQSPNANYLLVLYNLLQLKPAHSIGQQVLEFLECKFEIDTGFAKKS